MTTTHDTPRGPVNAHIDSLQNLIPICLNNIGGERVLTANLRDLHAWLGVKTKFPMWVKRRIKEYAFTEGFDFTIIPNFGKKSPEEGNSSTEERDFEENNQVQSVDSKIIPNSSDGSFGEGRPLIEYYGTLDMCKELSMVERTPRGKQARLYFIDCENRARQNQVDRSQHQALKHELLKANRKWRKILYCYRLGLSQRNTAKILNVTQECIWGHLARMKACGLIKATRATPLRLPLLD